MPSAATRAAAAAEMTQAVATAVAETPAVAPAVSPDATAPPDASGSGDAAAEATPGALAPEKAKPTMAEARQRAAADVERFAAKERAAAAARAESQRLRAEHASAMRERDEARARVELAEKDPLAYLEGRGVTADQLVARGLQVGTPEAKAAAELEAVRRELTELKNGLSQREQLAAQQQHTQAVRNYQGGFVDLVEKNDAQFPHLSAWPQRAIAAEAWDIAVQFNRDTGGEYRNGQFVGGEWPEHGRVLKYLEAQEKKRISGRKANGAAAPAQEVPTQAGPAKAAATSPTESPKRMNGWSARKARHDTAVAEMTRAAKSSS